MKIFFIIGRSGSGKDTIKNVLLKQDDLYLTPLVELVTRPKRLGEENDSTYEFTTNRDFAIRMHSTDDILESRTYDISEGTDMVSSEETQWMYGFLRPKYNENALYIGVGPIKAYKSILDIYGKEIVKPIYLNVSDFTILNRSILRANGSDQKAFIEICRRFISDTKDFSLDKIMELDITRRETFNNEEQGLTAIISKIRAYIIRNSIKERTNRQKSI